jgi:molybdopterin-guanine dinucleotide biosynthesis protein A
VEHVAARARDLPLTRDATLIVLAGGHSARMGRPKAELPVGDGTLLEWIVARLGPQFAETLVCGGAASVPAARTVADHHADAGPLAGIEAGLREMRTDAAFVLACDTPRATARLARLLLASAAGHDAAIPRVAGRDQPTCASYRAQAAVAIGAYLASGGRRVSGAIAKLDAVYVEDGELAREGIAAAELDDLDTPADYEAFIASLRP